MNAKILPRITVALLATVTGLYPVFYYVVQSKSPGILAQKPAELLSSAFYRGSFYTHITFGGVTLLIGWLQFSKKIRARNLNLHRTIGKMYMVAVALSGVAGFTIAMSASGVDDPQLFVDVCGGDAPHLFTARDSGYSFGFYSIIQGDLLVMLGPESDRGGGIGPAGAEHPGRSSDLSLGSYPGTV